MKTDKNLLEWTVFGVGATLVLGTAAYLAYDAIAVEQSPPSLQVWLGDSYDAPEGFAVPVVVENLGSKAAQSVRVRVETKSENREPQRAELVLEYVPGHASRRGTAVFSGRPVPSSQIVAIPVSFEEP